MLREATTKAPATSRPAPLRRRLYPLARWYAHRFPHRGVHAMIRRLHPLGGDGAAATAEIEYAGARMRVSTSDLIGWRLYFFGTYRSDRLAVHGPRHAARHSHAHHVAHHAAAELDAVALRMDHVRFGEGIARELRQCAAGAPADQRRRRAAHESRPLRCACRGRPSRRGVRRRASPALIPRVRFQDGAARPDGRRARSRADRGRGIRARRCARLPHSRGVSGFAHRRASRSCRGSRRSR